MGKIIDISSFNGKIDWDKVTDGDIDIAIIRCGYGKNVKKQDDKQFANNMEGAIAHNIPVSVYLYSYAIDEAGAENEAKHALRLLEPYKDNIGKVFIACEEEGTEVTSGSVAKTFCSSLNEEGYKTGVRAPISWFDKYLKDVAPTDRWVVSWGKNDGEQGEKPDTEYLYWQYTNAGHVDGINTDVALSTIEAEPQSYTEDNIDLKEDVVLVKKEVEKPKEEPAEPVKAEPVKEDPFKGEYHVIAKAGLNLRRNAGKNNEAVAVLPNGTTVKLLGENKKIDSDIWVKVKTMDGTTGYCLFKFLAK